MSLFAIISHVLLQMILLLFPLSLHSGTLSFNALLLKSDLFFLFSHLLR